MQDMPVKVAVDNNIAQLSIDSPPANALNDALISSLSAAVGSLDRDDTVRAVLITSSVQKMFLAGADLKEVSSLDTPGFSDYLSRLRRAFDDIERLKKPAIAVIEGHCLGAGCELALACDFRVMATGKSRIGLPEVNLGLLPGAGGTQRLPRLVGYGVAREMMLLGKTLTADEALDVGLVDRVYQPEEVRDESLKFAETLAQSPTVAIAKIKECLTGPTADSFHDGMKLEKDGVLYLLAATEDCKEGIDAFINKRKPKYRGR